MQQSDREPQMQKCQVCGSERTVLAYRVGESVQLTCLDVRGCQERQKEAQNA